MLSDLAPIANPDLPRRLKEGLPLNPYDRDTFYLETSRDILTTRHSANSKQPPLREESRASG
jgi:hypothetical protein